MNKGDVTRVIRMWGQPQRVALFPQISALTYIIKQHSDSPGLTVNENIWIDHVATLFVVF